MNAVLYKNYWKLNCAIGLIKQWQFISVFINSSARLHIFILVAHLIISTYNQKIPPFCSLLKNLNLQQMYFSYCILTYLSISKCIVWTNLLWSPEKKRFVSSASQIWMIKCAFDSLVHWEFGLNEQHYYWDKTILVHPKVVLLHFMNCVLLSIVCVSLPLCCLSFLDLRLNMVGPSVSSNIS